jgi:hypothetical protein
LSINIPGGVYFPFRVLAPIFESVDPLSFKVLDSWCVGKPQQVRGAKNGLAITMGVRLMDIAFDDIVVHEAIDYIGAFPLGGAYHDRIPKQTAFIDEAINTYPLAFTKIFK